MQTELLEKQPNLFAINANYRLWVYAVLVVIFNPKTGDKKWVVKFGDTRQNTYEDAHRYATTDGNTVGKLQGLVGGDIYVLAVEDVTDVAVALDPTYDPTQTEENVRKGFDNRMRPFMPGKSGMIVNEDGGRSLELHVMDDEGGTLTYDRVEYLWRTAIAEYKNGGKELDKAVYTARPYLLESFTKISSNNINKFLLAAATGAGKETSTLALLIYIHDQKKYTSDTVNLAVATIPSTTSELFNELATVAGMDVGNFGYVDYTRIKPYITEQWYKGYEKDCSEPARDFIRKNATVVKTVKEIPSTHAPDEVPVLFGSFHDIALKSEDHLNTRYEGLDKRIGTLAIGEAHQMLSRADNKMWKNLDKLFGKKCFKFFITGTPYDFIYGNAAAEYFDVEERALFTRNDLYKDKRTNPSSHYSEYPDFRFYGIDVAEIVLQLKNDPNWKDDAEGFTFSKLFTYDPDADQFKYEQTVLWLFRRMFGASAFDENGDPLSVYNAPGLCNIAKQHIMVALPVGNKKASANVYINGLKRLLIEHGVFPGEVFDAYDDDLGDRKDDIANAKGKTLTLTCNKDCTGANIPELGSFVFLRTLGDSVKFFEQATGRVGRKYKGKTNCGVFIGDLEASMNILVTIEEKISLERDENFSTNEVIESMLANYNFFVGKNGVWKELDLPDFAKILEGLNSRGNYGINQCIKVTSAEAGFDLIFNNTTGTENENVDINSNNNEGAKDKGNDFFEQEGLPFDKNKSADQNWNNMKLTFTARTRWLAHIYDIKNVQECVKLVQDAIDTNNQEILGVIGKGAHWFPRVMSNEHEVDIRYTNRWIQKFNDHNDDINALFEMFEDPIHRTENSFIAVPNEWLKEMANTALDVWDKNKNLIDPAGGRGGFIAQIILQAKQRNIKIDPTKLYYNDVDPSMVAFFKKLNVKGKFGIPESNITCKDFLTEDFDVYDLGICSPPGATPPGDNRSKAGNSNNSTLYLEFITKAPSVFDKILFVNPAAWTSRTQLVNSIKKHGLKQVVFHDNPPIEKAIIRSGLTIFYSEKGYKGDIEVIVDGKSFNQSRDMDIVNENTQDKEIFNTLAQFDSLGSKFKKGEIKIPRGVKGRLSVLLEYKEFSKEKTKTHPYALMAYAGGERRDPTMVYCNTKAPNHDKFKVILGVATAKYILGHTRIVEPGISVAASAFYIEAKDLKEAQRIKEYLDSPFVKYIASVRKNNDSVTTYKNLLNWIPEMPKKDIFEHFNLNSKQKKYILG